MPCERRLVLRKSLLWHQPCSGAGGVLPVRLAGRLRPQWVRALRVLPSSFLSSVVFTTTLGVRSQPPACAVALAGQHEILLFIDVSVGDTLSTARGRPRTVRFVWR